MKIEAYMNMMADLRAENEALRERIDRQFDRLQMLDREYKELKERLNHERILNSIKQQLAPKEYQFSANEKTILRSLNEKWKWLARDKDGILYVYTHRPIRSGENYTFSDGSWEKFNTFGHLFQSIQWTDDEPVEIEKVIRE